MEKKGYGGAALTATAATAALYLRALRSRTSSLLDAWRSLLEDCETEAEAELAAAEERARAAEARAEAAEAALFGALSAIARPPEGLCSRFLPAPLPRALDHRPSALLAAFFVTETGPETGGGRGGGGGGGEGSRSLSSLLPRNAAATAPPDGRLSADDGPLASARCVLERLFPGEGVEKLLLEKKKEKNRGTDDDGDDDEEALPAEAEAAAKQEEQGEREDDCCSSDEDAAGNLAAVLDALDAARENE